MTPPQNLEAERYVLGAVLLDNNALNAVIEHIDTESFYRESHRRLFEAMLRLHGKNEAIDRITLAEILGPAGIEAVGGETYLIDLQVNVPSAANAAYHARIVAEKAARRKVMLACQRALTGIESEDLDEILTGLSVQMDVKRGGSGIVTFRDVLKETQKTIEKRHTTKRLSGVPTGFVELDFITDGAQPNDYWIIGGRPSMGKSALAWAMAEKAVEAGHQPFIANIEMDNHSMAVRAIAIKSGLPIWKIRRAEMNKEEWAKFQKAIIELSEMGILFDDTIARASELRQSITRAYRKGADICFVDYLQLVSPDAKSNQNRERDVAEISRMLKTLTKQLRIPIIALAQLNRAVEMRVNKRPVLADLRESGQIEQDADVIMFLYREAYYSEQTGSIRPEEQLTELIIRKGRNIAKDTIYLRFDEKTTGFEGRLQ